MLMMMEELLFWTLIIRILLFG
uniref:Uncharacterized protein n=1 Tax=Anguilla anguilla TaxID=7936 RepID=A0A0E9S5V9_ANGAN